jgi:phosphoribosylpyrophosphate synthetase
MENINKAISKIFKDTDKIKKYNPDQFSVGKYYPKGDRNYEEMDEFSRMILDIKKDEEMLDQQSKEYYYYMKAVNYFKSFLSNILSNNEEFVMCVMPSSTKGTSASGIRKIAESLCRPPIIDGTRCIYRNESIPKKHLGGERNLEKEIASLSVQNENIIKDKIVLLLDDVTTTGTTFEAGIHKLKTAGACEVIALALGKTTY